LSRAAREALVLAEGEADRLGHRYIQNEHILLGLVESGDCYAGELLRQKGLSAEKLRLQIKALPNPRTLKSTGGDTKTQLNLSSSAALVSS
jgi:ATP-dependent Clp protease ATP-binding subunit ClpC